MPKDFWSSARVAVVGGGSFGTVLASLAARNCRELRLWVRTEEQAREVNATRINKQYMPALDLPANVTAYSDLERVFEGGVQGVLWSLPSKVARELARCMAPLFKGDEILIHATKGVEEGSLKRISEVLREEIPCPRVGVLSGPNLAHELARGEPAATVVASDFDEVQESGLALLANERFRIYPADDVVGVEWAGTLKNILAIAAGALDAMKLGWNARALLITRGLAEMVRFGVAMGARESTFLGLAGVGDLLATCSSPLSRNYTVGLRLANGETLDKVVSDLETTAEGVRTTQSVHLFAVERGIDMPITAAVYQLLYKQVPIQEIIHSLMTRPAAN